MVHSPTRQVIHAGDGATQSSLLRQKSDVRRWGPDQLRTVENDCLLMLTPGNGKIALPTGRWHRTALLLNLKAPNPGLYLDMVRSGKVEEVEGSGKR